MLLGVAWWAGLLAGNAQGQVPTGFRAPVTYRIEARLVPKEGLIRGTTHIRWTNYSPDPVERIPIHLYMNAFEGPDTTFFREERLASGESSFDPAATGGIQIRKLDSEEMGDLLPALRFIQPDDGNPSDRTLAEVRLPKPVAPGSSVQLHAVFETRLPSKVYARSGRRGNFFMAGQWFPKVAVLEPPGWRHAAATRWNCHQYHRNSEFYSNFANYEVWLSLPNEYKVGATGREVARKPATSGRRETVCLFRQEAVVDFAWAAAPDFIEVTEKFTASTEVGPEEYAHWSRVLGVSPESLRLPDVSIRLLVQPDHEASIPLFLRTLKHAIKLYGLMFGPYPYAAVTLVDPPVGAIEAGGMEYPTLFTGAFHRILQWWPLNGLGAETVITHEFGHNYWMGVVASNEFEEPWIDEGINSYAEARINAILAGREDAPMERVSLGSFAEHRWITLRDRPLPDALDTASWCFAPGGYSANAYGRAATMFLTLEHLMGRAPFARTLRGFYQAFRFRHPDTRDFTAHFAAAGGETVRRFLAEAFAPAAWVDYAVSGLTTREDRSAKQWESVVTLERHGTIVLPVDVEIRFEDGRVRTERWDGESRWTRYAFRESSPVVAASVDPGLKVPLDRCFANNSRTTRPRAENISRLQAIFQFLVQVLLHLVALLA
ncbi:MAG: M1 family metallopeptidase [Acidobacteria bacterium]|nr:M1 family metallopeptidase [Acidobacteriota bacterium]